MTVSASAGGHQGNEDSDNVYVGQQLSEGVRVTVLTLGSLACVNGVFGNVLIIITLLSQQALRSVHNIYIANLALADLLVVGYVLVFWLLDLGMGHHPMLNEIHCQLNAFILALCFIVSLYTIVMISFNRYMRVCWNNIFLKVYTRNTIVLSCVLVWIFVAFLCAFPFMHISDTIYGYVRHAHLCTFDPNGKLYTYLSVVNFFLPACLIGFSSLSIFRFWKRSKTRIGTWTQTQNNITQARTTISSSDISLMRSLLLVFLLLVVFNIPVGSALALEYSFKIAKFSSDVYVILMLFVFFNSSINWIIYGLMNKNFLKGYKRLWALFRKKFCYQAQ